MASPSPSEDPYGFLGIKINRDGSVTRSNQWPTTPATPQPTPGSHLLALSKDIPLNPTNATFLRLYLPLPTPTGKLPIIVYLHGGGYVTVSAAAKLIHDTCNQISAQSPALIVSLEYRLAPEHRLPAGFDDAEDAIRWLRDQAVKTDGRDEWLAENADFSKVYLIGPSAGAGLSYFTGLRAVDLDLAPIKIVGLVIDQPFIGGVERTKSELQMENDDTLPLALGDAMWSMALPAGADRDHEYCNPFGERHRSRYEKNIKRLPKCLVRGKSEDPLIDRQRGFAKFLESLGVAVTGRFYDGGMHTEEISDLTGQIAQQLYDDVKAFIST